MPPFAGVHAVPYLRPFPFQSGRPDAGEVDGLVVPRIQFHHHGVCIEHLHHLGEEGSRD